MPLDPELAARGWTPDSAIPADLVPPDLVPAVPVGEPRGEGPGDVEDDPIQDPSAGQLGGVRHRRPSWWRRIGRGGRFVETWVPETLRDARIDPGRRGALVLSLVAALAAVAAAVGVWRDRPEPRPVQAISHSAGVVDGSASAPSTVDPTVSAARAASVTGASSSGSRGARSTGASDPTPAVLAVSVTGAVRRPGLVRVPAGSRVADAIAAAGGVTPAADITGLNVATVLGDGDSVVVGTRGEPGRTAAPGPAGPSDAGSGGATDGSTADRGGSPVDLNTADSAALEELPGVGPVMADNIIAWRDANGPFTAVEQLQEISGIGPARYAQLAPLVTVG